MAFDYNPSTRRRLLYIPQLIIHVIMGYAEYSQPKFIQRYRNVCAADNERMRYVFVLFVSISLTLDSPKSKLDESNGAASF